MQPQFLRGIFMQPQFLCEIYFQNDVIAEVKNWLTMLYLTKRLLEMRSKVSFGGSLSKFSE